MTTYFTNFSGYSAGSKPSDWTARLVTANSSWLVTTNAGFGGAKNGLVSAPTADGRHALSWDAIDADPNRANVEVVTRWKSNLSTTTDGKAFFRGSGGSGSENYYACGVANNAESASKVVAGTPTTLGSTVAKTITGGTWYWTRARVNGSTVLAKTWADGVAEPGTWDITRTDTDLTAAGWVGLLHFVSVGDTTFDLVGVGTNGDTAPVTAPPVTVNTGSPITIEVGATFSRQATAASSGGTIVSHAWTKISGPALTLTGASTDTVGGTPATPGKYILQDHVTDSVPATGDGLLTLYVLVPSGDEARPDSTITAGAGTVVGGASVHAVTADESSATYYETGDNPVSDTEIVGLPPMRAGAKSINYELDATANTPAGTVTVELLQLPGMTVIASVPVSVTTAGVSGTITLTSAQNAAVTDPKNLGLRCIESTA